ncbi:MAG: hypothetical protein RIQ60_2879 [Pseudomonadota bacterium]
MQTDLFDSPPTRAERLRQLLATPVSVAMRALASWRSLHTRVGLLVVLAALCGIAAGVWESDAQLSQALLDQARQSQQARAERLAAHLGRELARLQAGLLELADDQQRGLLSQPERAPAAVAHRPAALATLDSLLLAERDGRVRLRIDATGAHAAGGSVAEAASASQAQPGAGALISDLLIESTDGHPLVEFVQDLRDAQGVWGLLVGRLSLVDHGLAAGLEDAASLSERDLLVISDRRGRILAHPARARLKVDLSGERRLASAVAEWRKSGAQPAAAGSSATQGWVGDEDVVAMAAEPLSGWRVWLVSPRSDVLAPLDRARLGVSARLLLWGLALGGLGVAAMAWMFRPLRMLERQARRLLAGDPGADVSLTSHGEVGQLARILHHVWAERTQAEGFNNSLLKKLGSVMAAAPVGLAFTRQQRYELVSVEFCQLMARPEADLLGQPGQTIFASADDYTALGPLVRAAFEAGQPYRGDWKLRRGDGVEFWGRLQARPVDSQDPGSGTIWSLEDVSELLLLHRQLEHAAVHDPLTGIYNRKGFEQVLASIYAGQPHSRPATVLMIDLDKFKPINDSAGHAAGDAVLQAVTRALVTHVRLGDTVARLGGDEFAVILPSCPADGAHQVAEKLVQAVTEQRVHWEGRSLGVGASIGVAELQAEHDCPSAWLADADAACYEAKRQGRGTVRVAPVRPLAGASQRQQALAA